MPKGKLKATALSILLLMIFPPFTVLPYAETLVSVEPTPLPRHSVPEASGVVASRVHSDIYWMVSDWGNPPRLYAVNSNGQTVKAFDVSGAVNDDWEDIAIDEQNNLWIGNIGDNGAGKSTRWLYKVAEPDPYGSQSTVSQTLYRFVYPNGPRDADSVFVWQGVPYVMDKSQFTHVYRFPALDPTRTVTLQSMIQFTSFLWVSGADVSRDGRRLALISDFNDNVLVIERDPSSTEILDFFTSPSRTWRISFYNGKGDGIGFVNGTYDFVAVSESGSWWLITQNSYDNEQPAVHSTTTGVICSPSTVEVATSTTCTATVTDAATTPSTPTGSVSFTVSGGSGTGIPGSCTLSGNGASASCSVSYIPSNVAVHSIGASYAGDAVHSGSSAAFALSVGAASFSFGAGGDIGDSELRPPNPTDCATVMSVSSGENTACSLQSLGTAGTSFFLALGDLSYGGQSSTSFCDTQKAYLGDTYPYELVGGNHEMDGEPGGNIFEFTPCLPDRLGSTGIYGVRYYFDYPAASPLARIIMIAPTKLGSNETYGGTAYNYTGTCATGNSNTQWLCNAIDGARNASIPWVIVGWHRPCISTGEKSCGDGTDLFNLLISKKVDLVLHGHEHNYQRTHSLAHNSGLCDSVPINGVDQDCIADFGDFDNSYEKDRGTVFATQGTFGKSQYQLDETDTERAYFAKLKPDTSGWGFVKYTVVSGTRIEAVWIKSMGNSTFTDSFSIVKTERPERTLTFNPTDDAWIQQNLASSNFGADLILQTDSSPVQHFLLKFSVTGIGSGQVTGAKVRLFANATDQTDKGGDFYRTNTTVWTEATVTWNNAPNQTGSLLASLGPVSSGGTWVEATVTPSVVGDGVASFRVSSPSPTGNGIDYHSKETLSGNMPELVVTFTPAEEFDYSLSIGPTSGSVATGSSTTAIITSTLTGGTPQPISFTATGAPAEVTISFSPPSCSPSPSQCTYTVTFAASTAASPGSFTITISGGPSGRTPGDESCTFSLLILVSGGGGGGGRVYLL